MSSWSIRRSLRSAPAEEPPLLEPPPRRPCLFCARKDATELGHIGRALTTTIHLCLGCLVDFGRAPADVRLAVFEHARRSMFEAKRTWWRFLERKRSA